MESRASKRGLIFFATVDRKGRGDAHGAFIPKAHDFARYHSMGPASLVGFDNTMSDEKCLEAVYGPLRKARGYGLDLVAYFGHGLQDSLNSVPIKLKHIPEFANLLKGVAGANFKVLLYACSAGRPGGFAQQLSAALGPNIKVFGHSIAGHSAYNPYVTMYPSSLSEEFIVKPPPPQTTEYWWDSWVCKMGCERKKTFWKDFPFMSRQAIFDQLEKYDHNQVNEHREECPYHVHSPTCKKSKEEAKKKKLKMPGAVITAHHHGRSPAASHR